jgi:hypothetical protein
MRSHAVTQTIFEAQLGTFIPTACFHPAPLVRSIAGSISFWGNQMLKVATVIIVVLAMVSRLHGQPADHERLRTVITQLDSASFVEREKAARELEKIGGEALPALRKALGTPRSPETRRRIEAVVDVIERRERSAMLLAPTRLRLNVKDINVPDAVAALVRLSGHPIYLSEAASANAALVTLDTGETTYWDAFARLCKAGRLVENDAVMPPYNVTQPITREFPRQILDAPPGMHLAVGTALDVPTAIVGSVRFRILKVAPASKGAVDLVVEISAEPRLHGLEQAGNPEAKLIDETGRSLKQILTAENQLTQSQRQVNQLLTHRTGNWAAMLLDGAIITEASFTTAAPVGMGPIRTTIRLQQGEEKSRSIKDLTGKILLQTNAETTPIVIDKILGAAGRSASSNDGGRLVIQRVETMPNKDVRIDLTWEHPVNAGGLGTRAMLSGSKGKGKTVFARNIEMTDGHDRRTIPFTGAPVLMDVAGKAWGLAEWTSHRWVVTIGKMTHHVTLVYRPGPDQKAPSRLSLPVLQAFIFEVPFAFKDVPLP